jgi:hypothetical protein
MRPILRKINFLGRIVLNTTLTPGTGKNAADGFQVMRQRPGRHAFHQPGITKSRDIARSNSRQGFIGLGSEPGEKGGDCFSVLPETTFPDRSLFTRQPGLKERGNAFGAQRRLAGIFQELVEKFPNLNLS